CCVCGLPIYQYHHIVPYHKDDPYPVAEMMILCPLHHDQATKGAMPDTQQWDYKGTPFNISHGNVEGQLVVNQDYCAIRTGGVLIVGDGTFIAISGERLLELTASVAGHLLLSVTAYDRANQLLARIEQNEW